MATVLMECILSDENPWKARHKVMSSKGAAGIDRMTEAEQTEYIPVHKDEMKETVSARRRKPIPVK